MKWQRLPDHARVDHRQQEPARQQGHTTLTLYKSASVIQQGLKSVAPALNSKRLGDTPLTLTDVIRTDRHCLTG